MSESSTTLMSLFAGIVLTTAGGVVSGGASVTTT